MKYKFKGDGEREVPSKIVPEGETKIVKPGDVFESYKEINNPDFEWYCHTRWWTIRTALPLA